MTKIPDQTPSFGEWISVPLQRLSVAAIHYADKSAPTAETTIAMYGIPYTYPVPLAAEALYRRAELPVPESITAADIVLKGQPTDNQSRYSFEGGAVHYDDLRSTIFMPPVFRQGLITHTMGLLTPIAGSPPVVSPVHQVSQRYVLETIEASGITLPTESSTGLVELGKLFSNASRRTVKVKGQPSLTGTNEVRVTRTTDTTDPRQADKLVQVIDFDMADPGFDLNFTAGSAACLPRQFKQVTVSVTDFGQAPPLQTDLTLRSSYNDPTLKFHGLTERPGTNNAAGPATSASAYCQPTQHPKLSTIRTMTRALESLLG